MSCSKTRSRLKALAKLAEKAGFSLKAEDFTPYYTWEKKDGTNDNFANHVITVPKGIQFLHKQFEQCRRHIKDLMPDENASDKILALSSNLNIGIVIVPNPDTKTNSIPETSDVKILRERLPNSTEVAMAELILS